MMELFFSSRPKDCVRSTAKKTGLFEKLSDPEKAYRHVQKWGFLSFRPGPADGISLTRTLASGIFPLPEERILAQDTPLVSAACLLGTVYGTSQVLASYIRHGMNLSMTQAWSDFQSRRDQILGNFLNDILQKMNKDRIISYYDSRYARRYYRYSGSTKELLKLAYKIPARFFCIETIFFSIETLWHCLIGVLGIKKKTPAQNKKTSQQSKGKAGKVEPECMVHSDAWRGYSGLVGLGYKKYLLYLIVSIMAMPQFANGKRHINGIESFWSYSKRRLMKFHGIPKSTFYLHLKECAFRFNYRNQNYLPTPSKKPERKPSHLV